MSINIKKLTLSKIKSKISNVFFCDFETTIYKNKHYVTCISVKRINSSVLDVSYSVPPYSSNYNLEKESDCLLDDFIKNMFEYFEKKDKTVFVYFHNLGKFDGIFIMNYLSKLADVDSKNVNIITRDNIIYEISYIKDNKTLVFRDSYLLFPFSLKRMAEVFGSEPKAEFPHKGCSIENYDNKLIGVLVSYCKSDTEILKECMIKFRNLIIDSFKIDIFNVLTMPSLAFKIFRTYYYPNEIIYKSYLFSDEFIRESYRGGGVDVYRPKLENGYYYDVNSLYPYIMANNYMPVGKPVWCVVGREELEDFDINRFFGFIKVKVKCPESLYIPFLTVKEKNVGLISPVGEWTDVYFSEEIKYALTLGYEFEYISYYKFDKEIIFSDYVNDIYQKRLESKNRPALSNIYKLLLNSLYGRFGMSTLKSKNSIIKLNKEGISLFKNIVLFNDVEIVTECVNSNSEHIVLIRYKNAINSTSLIKLAEIALEKEVHPDIKYHTLINSASSEQREFENVAVHIASAITAYARIYMHKLKDKYKEHIYYSDTDSLITDIELDSSLVSPDILGLLKLEYRIKKALFIAPKLYYMELFQGTIIKSKGVTPSLMTSESFEELYNDNPIKMTITRDFIRNFTDYTVGSKTTDYELSGNFNKRVKIYKNNVWVNTKPIVLNKTKQI